MQFRLFSRFNFIVILDVFESIFIWTLNAFETEIVLDNLMRRLKGFQQRTIHLRRTLEWKKQIGRVRQLNITVTQNSVESSNVYIVQFIQIKSNQKYVSC